MKKYWSVIIILTSDIIVHTYGQVCEQVSVPICSSLARFHMNTFQPNKHNFSDGQDSIGVILSDFASLFECSIEMQYFLCSTFLPVCENSQPIYPCRSYCLRAVGSERCQRELREISDINHGDLAQIFNCDNLNDSAQDGCIDSPLQTPTDREKLNNTDYPNDTLPHCLDDILYTSNAKRFAAVWLTICTVVTTLIISFTLFTILINLNGYNYPLRPILYILLSHAMYCLGILLRSVVGYNASSCQNGALIGGEFWNLEHIPCIAIFMTTYFGTVSGLVWWVILACCWLLSTLLQWSDGDIAKFKFVFHTVGWTVPTIQTLILISLRESQADELTGICSVNVNSRSVYLVGVILPTILYAVLGGICFGASILGILRTYRRMGFYQKHLEKRKVTVMVIRNSTYLTANSVTIALFITSIIYEYVTRPYNDELSCRGVNCRFASPSTGIIRVTSILASAILSTIWIWRPSTFRKWKKLTRKLINCKKSQKNTTILGQRSVMRDESFYDIGQITNLDLKTPGFVEISSQSSSENGDVYNTYVNSSEYSKPSQPTIFKWDIAHTESTCSTTRKSITTV